MYPYRDAGRFSDASQLIFLLRHHSWIYAYRDASQFSDASQRVSFYYVTIHGYTNIMMRVHFLMQVNGFLFTMSLSWVYPYRDAGQFSDASQRVFVYSSNVWLLNFMSQDHRGSAVIFSKLSTILY